MNRSKFLMFTCLLLLGAAVFLGSNDLFAQAMKEQAESDTTSALQAGAGADKFAPGDLRANGQMRATTQAQRKAARARQAPAQKGVSKEFAGVNKATAAQSPLVMRGTALSTMAAPLSQPDYFGVANWANSPLPTVAGFGASAATATVLNGSVIGISGGLGGSNYTYPYVTIDPPPCTIDGTTCIQATATATEVGGSITAITLVNGGLGYTGAPNVSVFGVSPGSGVKKFVDALPGICGISPWGPTNNGINGLGQCMPVAAKFTTPPVGVPNDGDYYEIGVNDFTQQMHSNLPATRLRGYKDLNPSAAFPGNHYLGPLIIAARNRPVRVKFTNNLAKSGTLDINGVDLSKLFIPMDNTYMGAGMGPDGSNYTQNRATLHLHGGNTPWISDGTPHQWITPASESASLNVGVSQRNVPDMPAIAANSGQATFFWTNQQSGRLMFFHDHAYGITRLNVYAGEAAGYLLVDPVQEDGLFAATVPGTLGALAGGSTAADTAHVVPLVIQDKTFVPDSGVAGGQLAATDPTWDVKNFGGAGSLWFPHVYMPNQNPFDLSGANPFGRWDYGPWFWPPQDPTTFVAGGMPYPCQSVAYPGQWLTCPGTPNPSGTPEAFMDTPVLNGTAYPTLTVEPGAYRFQILSAGNDRTLNLGLYYAADNATGVICKAGNVFTPANCTEMSIVPAVPHDATTVPPLCTAATATSGAMLAIADTTGGSPINGTGLPTGCWPTSWPTDSRDGGVPDPATAGPPIIQIGAEGGLLPGPVPIPSTPMGYEYNRRSITVLNVFTHGLTLGPAERADVVVDFSSVPSGSVLILYNDGPAPVPAFDPRSDYYTGDPDQTSTGGAPTTLPGYGPNTRTLMQIMVSGSSTNTTPFSYSSLATALPTLFASTQEPIIVPETAFPTSNGGSLQNNYVRIQDTSIAFFNGGPIGGVTLVAPNFGGGGYAGPPALPPSVVIGAPGCAGNPSPTCLTANATPILGPGSVSRVTMTSPGAGYTSVPTVGFTGGGGTGAKATAVMAPTSIASVSITNGGSGYIAPCTVNFSGGSPTTPATATATVQTSGQRKVTAIKLAAPNFGGAGYIGAPTVTITCTAGSGAVLTPRLTATSVASVLLTAFGSGYTSSPTVTFSGGGFTAAASATAVTAQPIAAIALAAPNFGGAGYTSAPPVNVAPPTSGKTATAIATAPSVPLLSKTIQELFTLDYGRMNATLGVELPFTNFLTQTTIPYGYVDPPTELFRDGETQYWKITHNGVDTHFIHFHLFTVQVINRVGWDGAVKPPDANEVAWKDTVRMNPLEDVVVALRPMKQNLPWDLPNSVRPLDVTEPVGSSLLNQFTNVDPTNQPAATTNDLTNFGWEYVWHCHILGHEENDMMRAMVFAVPPVAPGNLQKATGGILTWLDNSLNETSFTIQSASSSAGPWTTVATVPAVAGSGSTVQWKGAKSGTYYRVIANNLVGYTKTYAAPAVGWPNFSADSAALGPIQY